ADAEDGLGRLEGGLGEGGSGGVPRPARDLAAVRGGAAIEVLDGVAIERAEYVTGEAAARIAHHRRALVVEVRCEDVTAAVERMLETECMIDLVQQDLHVPGPGIVEEDVAGERIVVEAAGIVSEAGGDRVHEGEIVDGEQHV